MAILTYWLQPCASRQAHVNIRGMIRVMEEIGVLRQYFEAQSDIIAAYLFGSHARATAGPLSDVDVAVLFGDGADADKRFDRRLEIGVDLSGLLMRTGGDVDVVVLDQASLALAYRVLRDGILLACHDDNQRIQYSARVISMYLDFKPLLERHERAILERASKGDLLNGYNPHRGALERYRQVRERLAGSVKTDL